MEKDIKHIRKAISDNGLRVTPQRVAVLNALHELENHPTADEIIQQIRKEDPHMAVGTVYNSLEALTEKGIIKKVKTDTGVMRYDALLDKHYHLYCEESNRIEDYYDNELTQLIEGYFKKKNIDHFQVEDIQIQINGKFTDFHRKHKN